MSKRAQIEQSIRKYFRQIANQNKHVEVDSSDVALGMLIFPIIILAFIVVGPFYYVALSIADWINQEEVQDE